VASALVGGGSGSPVEVAAVAALASGPGAKDAGMSMVTMSVWEAPALVTVIV
jgi:hypothetical protein